MPRLVDLELLARLAYGPTWARRKESADRAILTRLFEEVGGLTESIAEESVSGRAGAMSGNELEQALRLVTLHLLQALRRRREFQRYLRFELPAQRVLLSQARIRVVVDAVEGGRVAAGLTEHLRRGRVELVRTWGIDPRDLIVSATARSEFAGERCGPVEDEMTLGDLRAALDSDESELGAQINAYVGGEFSRRAIVQLVGAGGSSCQTIYDVNGTSTGRVTMRAPGVQWLEKRYRGLILPGEGRTLRYLDYSCFEPTILAAASDDEALTEACSGDLYARVAGWLSLQGAGSRDSAKEVWLRLMYGQAEAKIVKFVASRAGVDPEVALTSVGRLRRELAGGIAFAERLRETAISTGFIVTPAGNRLKCDHDSSYKALILYLQSAGALIFKLALVRVFGRELRTHLVAPMHDAFLCAFQRDDADSAAAGASILMEDAFEAVMGKRLAKVVIRTEF